MTLDRADGSGLSAPAKEEEKGRTHSLVLTMSLLVLVLVRSKFPAGLARSFEPNNHWVFQYCVLFFRSLSVFNTFDILKMEVELGLFICSFFVETTGFLDFTPGSSSLIVYTPILLVTL